MGEIDDIRQRNETNLVELKNSKENNDAMIDAAKRDLKIFFDNKMQREEKIIDLKQQRNNVDEQIRKFI